MTRAQMEAARERVAVVLEDRLPLTWKAETQKGRDALCSALVTAVLGHPDGKAPKQPAGAGRRARRFAR